MERNVHFETAGLQDIVVHLAWAQLEIFADDVDKIQVLAAGDENSVTDLRVGTKDKVLLVEQPQYGLSLNLMESRWMQVCIRVPRSWAHEIHANTISGMLSARGLKGSAIVLDTISADLRALRLSGKEIGLKTISGDVRGESLEADTLSVRSVSGLLKMEDCKAKNLKGSSVSGEQTYGLSAPFQRVDINAVSGDVALAAPMATVNVSMRSISGRVRTEGVTITEAEDVPAVRVTAVSANLALIAIKE